MFEVDLNGWAQKLVEGAAKSEYSCNLRFIVHGGPLKLHQYTLPDGRMFYEYVQGEKVVEAGTVVFLALYGSDGKVVHESLWSERAIQ